MTDLEKHVSRPGRDKIKVSIWTSIYFSVNIFLNLRELSSKY